MEVAALRVMDAEQQRQAAVSSASPVQAGRADEDEGTTPNCGDENTGGKVSSTQEDSAMPATHLDTRSAKRSEVRSQ
jgi:hypothetical protein